MRTLRDMNMSKFVAEDVPLFLSLIADIFPGIKADKAVFPDVEAAMAKVATEKGLQLHPSWLAKPSSRRSRAPSPSSAPSTSSGR
jgi:dynein heavy chain, axonemal